MKTSEQLSDRLDLLVAGLHLHHDSLQGYFVGQITALLWALNRYPAWIDAHIATEELWTASRATRQAEAQP